MRLFENYLNKEVSKCHSETLAGGLQNITRWLISPNAERVDSAVQVDSSPSQMATVALIITRSGAVSTCNVLIWL